MSYLDPKQPSHNSASIHNYIYNILQLTWGSSFCQTSVNYYPLATTDWRLTGDFEGLKPWIFRDHRDFKRCGLPSLGWMDDISDSSSNFFPENSCLPIRAMILKSKISWDIFDQPSASVNSTWCPDAPLSWIEPLRRPMKKTQSHAQKTTTLRTAVKLLLFEKKRLQVSN